MKKHILKIGIIIFAFLFTPISSAFSQETSNDPLDGYCIVTLTGGLCAKALLDTYYIGDCTKFIPVNYYITIEGRGVLNPGTNSGTFPGRQRGWVWTQFAFGFGPVTLSCKTYIDGKLFDMKSKPGFMIGFVVLAI